MPDWRAACSAVLLTLLKGITAIYTCITVGGPEREHFLQGQLTQDLASISVAESALAAWCNPKGRVLMTARLVNLGEAFGLFVPESSAEFALQRLKMYRLRAKVDLDIDGSMTVIAVHDGDLPADVPAPGSDHLQTTTSANVVNVRLSPDSIERYGPADELKRANAALSVQVWRAARIAAGLVDIDVSNAERFTPHMLNLDKTGAISFDKGCYTGQEVVARTQHLGRVKRRVNRYRWAERSNSEEELGAGSKLSLADAVSGDIVNAAGGELLAVVPVERFAEMASLNGQEAKPLPLPYSIEDTPVDS